MYQPVSLFIGMRYMRGRESDRFGQFVSWLSAIGIMLGVMALITVLSVMNGLEKELEKNTLSLMPQVLITSIHGSLNPIKIPSKSIHTLGVNRITPISISEVIVQSPTNINMGVMLGINPNEKDSITPYLVNVNQKELKATLYNIILGKELAKKINIHIGDRIRLIVPAVNQLTPLGLIPSQRLFNVIGIFSTNNDIDTYEMLVNQQDASRLLHYPKGNITGWRLWLNNPLQIDHIIKPQLQKGLIWKDWKEQKGELFQAVKMEKNIMGLLISLIILVAGCNIMSSLSLLIMDKRGEIAILQTQGLTRIQIMLIFMIQGSTSGFIGALTGALLGIFLTTQINNLIPKINNILLNYVNIPIDISIIQVITITIAATLVALVSTFYPSWRATIIQPAEALRYE